jgi:ATP/maltotriose-dependent transcriptional regulator MalT
VRRAGTFAIVERSGMPDTPLQPIDLSTLCNHTGGIPNSTYHYTPYTPSPFRIIIYLMMPDRPPSHILTRHYPALAQSLAVLIEAQQWEAAAHLVTVLGNYWENHEHLSEGIHHTNEFLAATPASALPPLLAIKVNLLLGNLHRHHGAYPTAIALYEEALPDPAPLSDPRLYTALLSGLGEIAFRRGDYSVATGYYQNYLQTGEAANSPALIADGLNALGRIAAITQNPAGAMELHHEGQALAQQANHPMGIGWSLNAQGEVARIEGNYKQARDLFLAGRTIFEQLDNPATTMLVTQNLAFTLLYDGQYEEAERLLHTALRFWQRGPSRHAVALCLIGLAQIDIHRRHYPQAAQRLALAEATLRQIGVVLELGDGQACAEAMDTVQRQLGQERYWHIASTLHHHPLAPLLLENATPPPEPSNIPLLTPREVELLALVAQGLSDKAIATRLTISPHTVNAHLRAIYRKLNVTSRTAALVASRHQKYLI